VSKNFGHYLHNTVFGYKSLIPAMGHKPKVDPGTVSNLSLNGNTLSWDPVDNARVTIYAIPSDISVESFDRQADYLLGVSYDSSYTIPSTLLSNHYFAVCIYDRYGYEYSPAFSATPSGINSISLNNGVRIAGSELIVDLPEGYITVTATAIDGRLIGDIYSGQSNGATAIPLSSLGHGAYIISVKSASGLQSLKVIL
jgi:hypothetical protein